jgi:MFS family permease
VSARPPEDALPRVVHKPAAPGGAPLPGLFGSADTATQRRIVRTLVIGQILGGIGMGATLSLGALLASQLSGSTAWSGMAATMSTLGAAALAVPLARLAQKKGRRRSLGSGSMVAAAGAVVAVSSVALHSFPALLLGLMLLGGGSATNLQARFAATDLARPDTRARDLSVVVWSTTIGAVLGPNLFGPGEAVGAVIGLPPMTGAFAFSLVAQLAAASVYTFALRPDPLLTALATSPPQPAGTRHGGIAILRRKPAARFAIVTIALSHATMVALMSMAPVHLRENGAALTIVGFSISLHVAGMYALSPVFGRLSDKLGRIPVILAGQAMLLASLLTSWLGGTSQMAITIALILLGLGWSASVLAASALVAGAVEPHERAPLQGLSDLSMNGAGALGGALAGPTMMAFGYSGLALGATSLVAVVTTWALVRSLHPTGAGGRSSASSP